MTLTALGTIEELQLLNKGYYKLVVSTPIPFETKILRFNVWDTKLLNKSTGDQFDINEQVKVRYHLKEAKFPTLDELLPATIDSCPICHNALPAIDTQRMDCHACSIIPPNEHKEWVNKEPMRLMSCTAKEYLYSLGYRIELLPLDCEKPFTCVIFPNTLLYSRLQTLKVGNVYNILAWKKGNLLNLLDMF